MKSLLSVLLLSILSYTLFSQSIDTAQALASITFTCEAADGGISHLYMDEHNELYCSSKGIAMAVEYQGDMEFISSKEGSGPGYDQLPKNLKQLFQSQEARISAVLHYYFEEHVEIVFRYTVDGELEEESFVLSKTYTP